MTAVLSARALTGRRRFGVRYLLARAFQGIMSTGMNGHVDFQWKDSEGEADLQWSQDCEG